MANGQLPAYLASAQPNPVENRAPWFANTAPAYFGIFMWVAFYNDLGGALGFGGIVPALIGLVIAGFVSHYLYHYVFGLLGMKTGYPLYIVGSSTFGTKGGLLFPGIFMGLLQIGWYSVGTYFAADLVLRFLEMEPSTLLGPGSGEFDVVFVLVAIAWGYIFATFGAFGIKYVAAVSTYLPWIALAMLVIAFFGALPHLGDFQTTAAEPSSVMTIGLVIQLVIGFFATAGAAGADFGTASRNTSDVNKAGLVGVTLAAIVAGGLSILIVAGAQGKLAKEATGAGVTTAAAEMIDAVAEGDIDEAVEAGELAGVEAEEAVEAATTEVPYALVPSLDIVSPTLSNYMWLLLAIGSMAPACFCASIIGNSLSAMIPSLPRVPLTLAGATVGIILAALGIAGNLVPFFGLIGASFGPICGAMVADYLLSGGKWAGPREGISIPGYTAWLLGFLVGIANNSLINGMLGEGNVILAGWHPTAVYSFIVGFVVYAILAKAGLQSKTVEMPNPPAAPAE